MSIPNEREDDEAEREDPKLEGDLGNIFLLTYISTFYNAYREA